MSSNNPHLRPKLLSASIAAIIGTAASTAALTPAHAQDDELEEVVVTGTRIIQRDFTANSPIVSVESDFFDQRGQHDENQRLAASYASLYKILPLLPTGVTTWLIRRGGVKWLRRIPSPLIAMLQGANALRCGDLRFLAYLQMYSNKVFHSLRTSLPAGKPAGECPQ